LYYIKNGSFGVIKYANSIETVDEMGLGVWPPVEVYGLTVAGDYVYTVNYGQRCYLQVFLSQCEE